MNLYPRNDSSYWWVDLRDYGLGQKSTKVKNTGLASKKYARDKVMIYLADNHLNPKVGKGLLGELRNRFLAYCLQEHSAKVYARDKRIIDLFVEHCGGPSLEIYRVTPYMVETFKAARLAVVEPATAHRDLNCVKSMFSMAVIWKELRESPAAEITVTGLKDTDIPKIHYSEEMDKIYSYSLEHQRRWWILYYNTGMRSSEAFEIRDKNLIGNGLKIFGSKTMRERIVPITTELKDELDRWPFQPDGYFLPRIHPDSIGREFRRTIKRVNKSTAKAAGPGSVVTMLEGTLHWTRHTFATNALISKDITIREVQDFLGHASLQTTEIYLQGLKYFTRDRLRKLTFIK